MWILDLACRPGKFGRQCSETCIYGYYGSQCKDVCSCTKHERCDPVKGCECIDFTGENCNYSKYRYESLHRQQ